MTAAANMLRAARETQLRVLAHLAGRTAPELADLAALVEREWVGDPLTEISDRDRAWVCLVAWSPGAEA